MNQDLFLNQSLILKKHRKEEEILEKVLMIPKRIWNSTQAYYLQLSQMMRKMMKKEKLKVNLNY